MGNEDRAGVVGGAAPGRVFVPGRQRVFVEQVILEARVARVGAVYIGRIDTCRRQRGGEPVAAEARDRAQFGFARQFRFLLGADVLDRTIDRGVDFSLADVAEPVAGNAARVRSEAQSAKVRRTVTDCIREPLSSRA